MANERTKSRSPRAALLGVALLLSAFVSLWVSSDGTPEGSQSSTERSTEASVQSPLARPSTALTDVLAAAPIRSGSTQLPPTPTTALGTASPDTSALAPAPPSPARPSPKPNRPLLSRAPRPPLTPSQKRAFSNRLFRREFTTFHPLGSAAEALTDLVDAERALRASSPDSQPYLRNALRAALIQSREVIARGAVAVDALIRRV